MTYRGETALSRVLANQARLAGPSTADPLTVTVPKAMQISGLGRTKLYEMISNNEIESVRVGTRRLIVFASLKARLTNKADEVEND